MKRKRERERERKKRKRKRHGLRSQEERAQAEEKGEVANAKEED
jgi:hypothetical protein